VGKPLEAAAVEAAEEARAGGLQVVRVRVAPLLPAAKARVLVD